MWYRSVRFGTRQCVFWYKLVTVQQQITTCTVCALHYNPLLFIITFSSSFFDISAKQKVSAKKTKTKNAHLCRTVDPFSSALRFISDLKQRLPSRRSGLLTQVTLSSSRAAQMKNGSWTTEQPENREKKSAWYQIFSGWFQDSFLCGNKYE